MPVDPTGADLKRYLAEDPGGPVVMLNLLKYKENGGEAEYKTYAEKIQPFLDELGAEIVYVGDAHTTLVADEHFDYDAVLLVRYPSRRAFSQMVANPEYQRITGHRTHALDNAVLQATIPWAS